MKESKKDERIKDKGIKITSQRERKREKKREKERWCVRHYACINMLKYYEKANYLKTLLIVS